MERQSENDRTWTWKKFVRSSGSFLYLYLVGIKVQESVIAVFSMQESLQCSPTSFIVSVPMRPTPPSLHDLPRPTFPNLLLSLRSLSPPRRSLKLPFPLLLLLEQRHCFQRTRSTMIRVRTALKQRLSHQLAPSVEIPVQAHTSITSASPLNTAPARGDCPRSFKQLGSAPCWMSSLTRGAWPW